MILTGIRFDNSNVLGALAPPLGHPHCDDDEYCYCISGYHTAGPQVAGAKPQEGS